MKSASEESLQFWTDKGKLSTDISGKWKTTIQYCWQHINREHLVWYFWFLLSKI